MPCGHTDEEFAHFTKQEKTILFLVHDKKSTEEEILKELQIRPATLAGHTAHIKQKQSIMRVARANLAIERDHQRLKEKFVPETAPAEEEEAPPIPHPVSIPPRPTMKKAFESIAKEEKK